MESENKSITKKIMFWAFLVMMLLWVMPEDFITDESAYESVGMIWLGSALITFGASIKVVYSEAKQTFGIITLILSGYILATGIMGLFLAIPY